MCHWKKVIPPNKFTGFLSYHFMSRIMKIWINWQIRSTNMNQNVWICVAFCVKKSSLKIQSRNQLQLCENKELFDRGLLKNISSQETICHSLLLHLDLSHEEKLNLLDIKKQGNLIKSGWRTLLVIIRSFLTKTFLKEIIKWSRNHLQLFIGKFRPEPQRKIELIGH
jgi:hypothetical protein